MPSSPPDELRKPIPTAVTAAGLVNSSNHFWVDTLAGIPCGGLLFGQLSQLEDHVSVTCLQRSSVLHTVGSGEGSGGFHILNGDILKARQGSLRDCDLVIGMSSLYSGLCLYSILGCQDIVEAGMLDQKDVIVFKFQRIAEGLR